jgi:asparagine synthase (glutamine-hydrolysing)
MCGIAAAFAPDGAASSEALTETASRLADSQAHRGPDDAGQWNDGGYCALAHRRLAVIDLTPGGHQPMLDASGRFAISYNGELYNFEPLRAELESLGHVFRSRSDTEVLLAAYSQWGNDAFRRLDGMFALALYDRVERRLVLARDRAGEKPLYYAWLGKLFVAASELRAIATLPGASRALDPQGVFDYLALRYVPAPRTILSGVHALQAATVLTIAADGTQERSAFHAFDRAVDALPRSLDDAADGLEEALAASLERRLLAADVPVGAFLSSGIDSSLVCALASRRLRRTLLTFCAGFESSAEDETAASRRIAETLGLPHRTYVISSADLLGVAQRFGAILDEPNGDRSCVPVYLLAREIRREVTVAISGDGGDELFCGYERYPGFDAALRAARPGTARDGVELYFERALPVFPPSALKPLFPEEYAAWREEFLALYAPVVLRSGWNAAQRLSVLDYHTYLPGAVLSKVDRMCMRHALEVRTPFLEARVMDLAASLPPALCANGALKPLLRRLLERHLPTGLTAARKIGFGMPAHFMQAHAQVFRGMFDAACESLRASAFFASRRPALEALIVHAPGNVNSLWALTVLGLWADSVGLC